MPDEWQRRTLDRKGVMFRALTNLRSSDPTDAGVFDFAGLIIQTDTDETVDNTVLV
ncbi:MAG: hypothetical protein AAF713_13975 [Pseudomonadota bacterium]